MEYVQMTLNDWMNMKHKLKMELQGVKQSFVRIGYVLRQIDDQKLYEQDGYKTIAEFAKREYGLEASTVSRFMSINKEYSIDGYSEHLREEYLEMTRSQLEEMLKLPDKDREMVRPETPRADIRELKHFNKSEPVKGVADDLGQLIEKFFQDNKDALNAVYTKQGAELKNLIEVVNPNGNRSYRKGIHFMMMYEDKIIIKKFGQDPQKMPWEEFFQIMHMIFDDFADGANTWNKYFGGEENVKHDEIAQRTSGSTSENERKEHGDADRERDRKAQSERAGATAAVPNGTAPKQNDSGSGRTTGEKISAGTSRENSTNVGKQSDDAVGERIGKNGNSGQTAVQERNDVQEEPKESVATSQKEKKEEIAPAQKVASDVVHTECEMVSEDSENEQIPGQMEVKDFPELMPDDMNPPVEGPFMTRKAYLDTLTEHGMAEYMAKTMREGKGPKQQLFPSGWEEWLMTKVDERGREDE